MYCFDCAQRGNVQGSITGDGHSGARPKVDGEQHRHSHFRDLPWQSGREERPEGRAKLLAKRGPAGQMQTPPKLVPVRNGPQCGVKAPIRHRECSGKLLHFGKIPKQFG